MSKPIGRPKKDEDWIHVTKEENGKWKCKYCKHEFSGKISITRIRAHINKETGRGTAPCSFDRGNEGDLINMASGSTNPQQHVNDTLGSIQVAEGVPVPERIDAIASSSIQHQNNIDCGGIDGGKITLLNQLVSDLQNEESDIEGQVYLLQCRGKKRKIDVDFWLDDVEQLRKSVDELTNVAHTQVEIDEAEIDQLIEEIEVHKAIMPLVLSTEIVGENFEENIIRMWELLIDDEVFIIGVYGMGGVGKTLFATHLKNEIKRKGSFKDVFWVTVSQNFTTSKLQHDIAKRMGVKLDEDDEIIRAEILSLALDTREKPILILDDVWKYIDLEKVGIRRSMNGIKVILTTRLKHVCQQMDCLPNNMIQMLPLDTNEAEELFKVKLGHSGTPATLSLEVEEIATCIVDKCGGLPLGICVMARTLKGWINDIHWWKQALNKLEKLEMEQEVEEEVLKVLKRGYDNLMEDALQNCFLYCALFPGFRRHELILKLLDIGLFEGRKSLEEIFDEGNNILDKLISHSLLQEGINLDVVVSPFLTLMACNILKESQRCVVKFLEKKTYFQKELTIQERKDLELINLVICSAEEIPDGTSPHCPHLSTLIIGLFDTYGEVEGIRYFPECFFKNMNALTVLDLSNNHSLQSLPASLSDLKSLASLTLHRCYSLKYVSSLEKLQALSRLVISCCSIEQVAQGLEKIIKLKWLDLRDNNNLIMEPGFVDVLPNLTNIQYLDLRGCTHVMIKVEDVQGMNRLECLGGTFLDNKHYNRYMEILLARSFGPKTYRLSLEEDCSWMDDESLSPMVPNNQRGLYLYDNDQWICLCGALSSKVASTLNKIKVHYCKQLKNVFCLSGSCICIDFCNLQFLGLFNLESLTVICKEDDVDVRQSLPMCNKFLCLTYLQIKGCHKVKKLLTPWLVLRLPNLESVHVGWCESMEEIIAVGNGGDNDGSSIRLPKLTTLELWDLPQLKTVCKGSIIFGSSPTLTIRSCPNLKWKHPAFPLQVDSFGNNF